MKANWIVAAVAWLVAQTFTVYALPSTVWVDDDYTSGSAGGHTWLVDAFTNIQAGVGAVDVSGTVDVAAGTYHEQVIISKALNLLGESAANTVIDGTGVSATDGGLVRIADLLSSAVTVEGFTIRNAQPASGVHVAVMMQRCDAGSSVSVTNNILIGSGYSTSDVDFGLYSYRNGAGLVFNHNVVTNTGDDPVILEVHTGPAEIGYNTITVDSGWYLPAIFSMSYSTTSVDPIATNQNDVTGKQYYHHNSIDANTGSGIVLASAYGYSGYNEATGGKYMDAEIVDNAVINVGDNEKGIQIEVDGDNGGFVSPIIARNTISAMNTGSGASRGIHLLGDMTGAQLTDNVVTGLYRGICQSGTFGLPIYPTATELSGNTISGGTYCVDVVGGTFIITGDFIVDGGLNLWGNAHVVVSNAAKNVLIEARNGATFQVAGAAIEKAAGTSNFLFRIQSGCSFTMTNSTLTGCGVSGTGTDAGLHIDTTNATLRGVTLEGNYIGLVFGAGAAGVAINESSIFSNQAYGVYNNGTVTNNARYNWWGDSTGPYHPTLNALGQGNPVSDYVDFGPWYADAGRTAVYEMVVTPASLAFGTIAAGTTTDLTFTVQNVGTGTLSGAASVGAPFSVLAPTNYSLAAGEARTVTVRYSPLASGSDSNDVMFTGWRGATRPVTGSAFLPPAQTVTPESLQFGSVSRHTTNELAFTVRNGGEGVLTGAVTGVAAPFSIVTGANYVLTGGASTSVVVRYAPSLAGAASNDAIFAGNGGTTNCAIVGLATNTPPTFAGATIVPAAAYRTNELSVLCSGWHDADGDPEGYHYQWKTNGIPVAGAGGSTFSSPALAVGDVVTCLVTAWDGASEGNSIETAARVIASRTTEVSVTSPTNGAVFVAPASILLTANATNADGAITQVVFYVDGGPADVPDMAPPFTGIWTNPAAGPHQVTAMAWDIFGTSASSLPVNVTVLPATRIIRLGGDLAFGGVQVLGSAQRALSIFNDGNSDLHVSSIAYPGRFSGAWSGTVGSGASTSVTVRFAPTSEGGYGGNLTVVCDATSGTNTLAVSGTGTNSATADIALRAVTAPIWAGGSLAPEPRGQTTTCAMAYTVRNNGAAVLVGKAIVYEIYLSVDTTFNTADRKIGQQVIGPLTLTAAQQAVQSNGTATVILPTDLTAGVYHLAVHAVLPGAGPIDPDDANNWKAAGTIVVPPKAIVTFPVSFPGRTVWALCWDATDQRYVYDQRIASPTAITIYDLKPNRWYWVVLDVETQEGNGIWAVAYASWFMRGEESPGRWLGNWTVLTPAATPFRVGPPLVWMLFERSNGAPVVTYYMDNNTGTWTWGTWTTAIYGGWVGFQMPLSNDWYAVFVADALAGVWY